ncbi:MAG TPA: patatin-like phospholipase family protein [Firmicutes bacterium]|nr:patatin-like phospholipase family protein [Bacillota bacterium]
MARPQVGLCLSAGGAKGLAHIGVLLVLEEEGIPIDLITGTSMGAVIGVLYGCGLRPRLIQRLVGSLRRKHWLDVTFPRMGLIAGERFLELMKMLSRGRDFADLRLPVAVVATDLERGEEVVLKSGPVAEAVRASSSIPGVFAPIRLDGRLLVDGAVLNRLPIKLAKEMGAEIVIASDVGWEVGERKITNIFDVIMQSFDIAQKELTQYIIPTADVLIAPELSHIPMLAMEQSAQCIHAGIEATRKAIPAIKERLVECGVAGL